MNLKIMQKKFQDTEEKRESLSNKSSEYTVKIKEMSRAEQSYFSVVRKRKLDKNDLINTLQRLETILLVC